ncbi:uncharacterized protein EV420DRAFT_1681205 [Desarmillaria tabescens]|uniref:Uncharacterized protein n=1 Tax=Armillaria tabescens TaxID=1929756 RepID=A0AA39N5Z0_ARMTA|nr:uncharacterized protein EV420DRAFT_1681205 [Desarmillaria tabescens]KAK0458674.1 hypothetical protein EV420DRAFT_1681205 [Desarmillaria tabescens]
MDTSEERRAAHNASSRRSYMKHRDLINQKRRDAYRQKKDKRNGKSLKPLDDQQGAHPVIETDLNSAYPHAQRCAPLTEAMDHIIRISSSFTILTLGSSERYADTLYQEYQRSITLDRPEGYLSLLVNAVLQVSFLEQSLLEQEHIILNSAGTGNEMGRLRVVLDPVRMLAGWLEEILFTAMISPANLRGKYLRRELAFLKYE